MNYRNLCTWREDKINCVPISKGGLTEHNFIDTKPNMFIVYNYTDMPIYIGISKIPYDKPLDDTGLKLQPQGEFIAKPNSFTVFGRPIPCNKLYFYNISGSTIPLTLYSIADVFDINILKDFSANLNEVKLGDISVETDGIIKGFQTGVSLPAGENKIGKVEVTNLNTDNLTISDFSGTYTAYYAENLLIEDDGNILFDYIECISNTSDTSSCDLLLYYSDTDFISVCLEPLQFLSNVDMPVKKIFIGPNGSSCNVSIFGRKVV